MLAQILDDPQAEPFNQLVGWMGFAVLTVALGAVLVGAALVAWSTSPQIAARGKQAIFAGLAGAFGLGLLNAWVDWADGLFS